MVRPDAKIATRRGRLLAIQEATLDVLEELGYEQLTIERVASRAMASRATIYRHWPSKIELVSAALRHGLPATFTAPDTGELRSDLRELLIGYARDGADRKASLVAGLVKVARKDEGLYAVLHEHVLDLEGTPMLEPIIRRAVQRGEIPATTDAGLITEIAAAMVYMHTLVMADTLTPATIDRLVDQVLLPLAGAANRPRTDQSPGARAAH